MEEAGQKGIVWKKHGRKCQVEETQQTELEAKRNLSKMKMKTQKSIGVERFHMMYVLTGIAVLFPLGGNFIMSGERIAEWIARVQELAAGFQTGHLYLYPMEAVFPLAETVAAAGSGVKGMDSNLWFFLPGAFYWLSENMVLTYRFYMLAVQIGTLAAAILMFGRIFAHGDRKLPVFLGVLLYMTCPYRIFLSYDLGDFSQATAWMLLPLYLWAILGIWKKNGKRSFHILIAAFVLAGLGYADVVYFLIAAGMTMLVGVFGKKWWTFVPVATGGVMFLPGLYRLVQYLFLDGFGELGMPLKSIMSEGYRFGQFFSVYAFRDSHPGMGLGMLMCILAGLWLGFVENKRVSGENKVFISLSILFAALSLSCFPWDFVQRLGGWALKLVSMLDTPAVFWGMACLCLCTPAACAVNEISKHENRRIAIAVLVSVIIACLELCVYQCSVLMCQRAHIGL